MAMRMTSAREYADRRRMRCEREYVAGAAVSGQRHAGERSQRGCHLWNTIRHATDLPDDRGEFTAHDVRERNRSALAFTPALPITVMGRSFGRVFHSHRMP
jgi:hypothetical protein